MWWWKLRWRRGGRGVSSAWASWCSCSNDQEEAAAYQEHGVRLHGRGKLVTLAIPFDKNSYGMVFC